MLLYNTTREFIMKSSSINETLYLAFGVKKYTKADYDKINHFTLSQYDVDGTNLELDLSELDNFVNLESVHIKDCALNDEKFSYLRRLKKLSFVRCDFSKVSEKFIPNALDELYLSDCSGLSTQLNKPKVKYFEIHKMKLNPKFCPKATELNVAGCVLKNYDFLLSPPLKKLTISNEQYNAHKKLFDNAPFKVDVMESNGQFIAKTIGGKK